MKDYANDLNRQLKCKEFLQVFQDFWLEFPSKEFPFEALERNKPVYASVVAETLF